MHGLRENSLLCLLLLSASHLAGTMAAAMAQGTPAPGDPIPQYVHEQWTIEDGLPVNALTRLIQTRDGYLWLTTYDGLVRFDGVRFTVFNTGNTPGLPSNRLLNLLEARDGSLWMGTQYDQVVRFKDGVFTSYLLNQGTRNNIITTLYEAPDRTIWIRTTQGLSLIRAGNPTPVPVLDAAANAVLLARNGTLWIGTDEGLKHYENGALTAFSPADDLDSNPVTALYEDEAGILWIGTDRGLYAYADGTMHPLTVDGTAWQHPVSALFAGPEDAFWISTETTLLRYHAGRLTGTEIPAPQVRAVKVGPEGHTWVAAANHLYRDGRSVFETSTRINDLLFDYEGNLWIVTNGEGLYRLKPAVFTVYSAPEGLVDTNVYLTYEDRTGALWFGTLSQGLSRLQDGVFTTYTHSNGLPANQVSSLYEDRSGTLWMGYSGGVCRFEGSGCVPFGQEQGAAQVRAIAQDRTGALWFGAVNGLFRYHADDPEPWRHFTTEDGLAPNAIRVLYETRDGALWLGTNGGGLTRYQDDRFTVFDTGNGLSSNYIRSIYQDTDGRLWIGTEDRGLNRLDLSANAPEALHRGDFSGTHVTVYRPRDGLYDDVIHQILEDAAGRLWMSSNRGIFWVNRADLNAFARGERAQVRSTSYTERDGLRSREANGGMQPAGIRARDGRLWFATQDGVGVVDPATIRQSQAAPPVVIEHLAVDDRALPAAEEGHLAAGQRNFEIVYTALSFRDPKNMRFRYRLEPFDPHWIEAGSRRTAYYTNVPPGDYVFRVVASNNDGVWNEHGATLALTIAPYFYEQLWFYLLCVLGLIGLGVAGYSWRIRTLKAREQALAALVTERTTELQEKTRKTEEQAQQLLELDHLKSRFFANVSHEFRTPLTLTIGPLEDLRAGVHGSLTEDADEQVNLALRSARRLLRLVNQLLDAAKLESGQMKLHVRTLDLVAFLRNLVLAFAPLAERKAITLQVALPAGPLPAAFDPDAMEKVFTNLLSNAFKFTPEGGSIRLALQHEDAADAGGWLRVIVKDSGPGIPADALPHIFERFYQADESQRRFQPGTGIGLALAKELITLHDGRIEVESEEGFGTSFTVIWPLGRTPEAEGVDLRSIPRTLAPDDGDAAFGAADEGRPSAPASGLEEADIRTVLVVDDNADVRSYVRRHLEPRYRVVEAVDGADGLDKARKVLPDLILSDVMMPVMDGYALCHALRRDPELDYIPVILLTAKATTEDKIEGLTEGADDYLTKPFNMQELEARLENLIALRQRLRDRFSPPAALHVRDMAVVASDAAFLEQVRAVIEAYLGDEEFSVETLASEVGLSRQHLHHRLRDLLKASPTDVIRSMRLERAAQWLAGQAGTVSEVAYGVGFKSVSHFSQCFRDQYSQSPSAYKAERAAGRR